MGWLLFRDVRHNLTSYVTQKQRELTSLAAAAHLGIYST